MKKILVIVIAIVFCKSAECQIGLGITTPHPNAYFQINSTNKGVLLPRMTAVQRLAIAPIATANGLMVFDTDSSAYMFWTGSAWKKMGGDDGNWIKNGNNIYNSNSGRVGIGTSTPLTKLHVVDSSVLFSGTHLLDYGSPLPPPITGEGSRMMWYAPKAALLAGNFDINCNNCWNKDSIGFHSIGVGYNPKAIGISSVSLGAGNIAREAGSIALGIRNEAAGFVSISMGHFTRADKYASVAIGDQAVASGAGAFSLGNLTEAAGDASFATGLRTKALGLYSFAAGNLSEARADYSIALGHSWANSPYSFAYGNQSAATGTGSFAGGVSAISFGENSFAFGKEVTTYANNAFCFGDNVGTGIDGSFVTGSYNELQVGLPDRIFEVANGTSSLRQNAFTILKTGAVGIGTVNPQYRLDVAGNIRAQTDVQVDGRTETDLLGANSGTIINLNVPDRITAYKTSIIDTLDTRYFKLYNGFGNAGYVLTSDAEGNGSWQAPGIGNWSTNVNDIYNNNPGNVGIGNSSPITPLSFQSSLGNKISLWGVDANNHYGFGVQGSLLQIYSAGSGDDIAFGYGGSNNFNERMRIKGNGNVGIGTSSPNAPLQLANTIANRKMVLYDLNDNDHQYYGLGVNGGLLRYQVDATGADHAFFAGVNTSSSSELMRIKGNGNVGIGASDPVYRLDVSGRMRIRSGGNINNTAGVWLNNIPNTASPAFVGMESDDAVGFYGNTTPNGWGVVMKIGTGNVGIGTSIPSQKLHVMGNILATGTITPSDIRYKKNIQRIESPLQKLSLIRGVNYTMNTKAFPEWKFDSTLQYGLIAQEVEKVFPEMVKPISENGYKGVDYVKLIPVLVEGIKELDSKNGVLEKSNALLVEENQQVKARLKILEDKVNTLLNGMKTK